MRESLLAGRMYRESPRCRVGLSCWAKAATKNANLQGVEKLATLATLPFIYMKSKPCLGKSVEDGQDGQHCQPLRTLPKWHDFANLGRISARRWAIRKPPDPLAVWHAPFLFHDEFQIILGAV